MTTEHAFLDAIKAEPDNDALRLIFADWLEDNGQPDRGELIRLQVRCARLPEGDPTRMEMEWREAELLHTHAEGWLGAWGRHRAVTRWKFRRGLLELWMDAGRREAGKMVRLTQPLAWLDALHVEGVQGRIVALMASPLLPLPSKQNRSLFD